MTKSTVFMYSGQGSQYFQMTRELYEQNARYRLWLEHCDDLASPILGKSLLDTIFDPGSEKGDPFDSLADSSVALLGVEYALSRILREMGHEPDVLLGYSLGEITAAVVAEVLPLEDAMAFVVDFAHLLERRTERAGMLAVIGAPELSKVAAFRDCWVTATNFDGNVVVSGRVADIDSLERTLESEGVICQRLPVNYGVHTELIDRVEDEARSLIDTLSFVEPQLPIISAATAERVERVTVDSVWAAMRQPVEFSRTVGKILAEREATFVDAGPSATLATFVKYIAAPGGGSCQVSTINRFGNDVKSMNDFRAFMAAL